MWSGNYSGCWFWSVWSVSYKSSPQLLKVLYLCLNMHVQCWTWFSLEMTWFIKMIQMWRRVILCDLKSVSWQVQNSNIGRTRGSLHSGNLPRTHCKKQAARRHVPTNDTRWVSGVIWHVGTCTTCWFCHSQNLWFWSCTDGFNSFWIGLDWIWIYFFFPRHIYLKA